MSALGVAPNGTADLRRPTDDELDRYRRDGFVVVRGLLDDAVLDAAEVGMARMYAGDLDAPFPGRTRFDHQDWSPEHGTAVLRKNDYPSRMVRELDALVRTPAIAAFAAGLAGASEIRLWHDQLLYKPPGDAAAGQVGWHTDRQYWQMCSSTEMLTCWVPFHDVDATTGVVSFVPGSHHTAAPDGLSFFDRDEDSAARVVAATGAPVAPDLRRGDVTFHHCRTVHGSGANRSGGPRRSMAIHLQPGDNHWVPAQEDDGSAAYHRSDSLVRADAQGNPDYADPRICPTLFPPAAGSA